MRLSEYLLPTLREAPSDADNVSAKLMIRAGMIRKLASGIFDWLPLGLRTLKKVEGIVREEMDRAGAQEVWLPVIQPRELWEETGRWGLYGKELLRIKDRKKADFCFAPTAEEVITDLVRREVRSWRQLPLCLYQFGLKFRDEIRPRFGVMRAREFLMKDAYSFHTDEADATRYYDVMHKAYTRVFERCGLRFVPVEAQSGAIGGSFTHEFMVLAETGEEVIVSCPKCGYAANLERAECKGGTDGAPASNTDPEGGRHGAATAVDAAPKDEALPLEEVPTPGKTTVEDVADLLHADPKSFLKTQIYMAGGKPVMALVRGDHEINEAKLFSLLGGVALDRASEAQYEAMARCPVGFAGPVNLPRWKTPEGKMEDVRIVADEGLRGLPNAVSGANKKDLHLKNINMGRDFAVHTFADLRMAGPEDPCPRCGAKTEFARGIEVGQVFKLGTKYSESLKATYLDDKQASKPMVMGCYGIGVSRVVAAAIEQGHDDYGIIWPLSIAPFTVALMALDADDEDIKREAGAIYDALRRAGVDVLLDDRPGRPGVRFKDLDLIGIPLRLVVSKKTLAEGKVEFKRRDSKDKELWPLGEAVDRITALTARDSG